MKLKKVVQVLQRRHQYVSQYIAAEYLPLPEAERPYGYHMMKAEKEALESAIRILGQMAGTQPA